MHPNQDVVRRFYAAFAALDAATMQACYAPDAAFRDEVFTLQGAVEIGAMWRMLCTATQARGREDWRLEASGIEADADRGRAHWEAHYRFSATGRRVHNIIEADFRFRDGLIVRHHDRFHFWRWSRQALGLPGLLLGWTPYLHNKVRAQAMARLARFGRPTDGDPSP
jgi:ketosteroid isomerase-like protein